MIIKTFCMSDIGGRTTNDDTASIYQEAGRAWVYVGDGLGSYAGGKRASKAAGDALLNMAKQGSMLSKERLTEAAEAADKAVKRLQKETKGNMKTTLVFLALEEGKARWMHVGDSRLYHFRDGKVLKQTTDHSVSQMAVFMGEITTHEIRFHEDRNKVLRALGGENAKAEISEEVEVMEGRDAFLLCTDGFWEYVYENEMEQCLKEADSPKDWVRRMEKILKTRVPRDNDNFTAAALFAGKPEKKAEPPKKRGLFRR